MGDVRRLRHLKRHFEGLEKINKWFDINSWILEIIDPNVRQTLMNTETADILKPGLTNEARELCKKIKTYLQSGKDYDFRMVLWTVSNIAKSRLKQSASLIKELEGVIKSDRSDLLVSVEMLRRFKPSVPPRSVLPGHVCSKAKQASSPRLGLYRSRPETPSNKTNAANKRPRTPDEETPIQTLLNTARIERSRSVHYLRKRPRTSSSESLTERTTALPLYCIQPGSSS